MKLTKTQIKAVLTSASKDASRFNLNAVLVESDRLISTDGHRLTVVYAESPDEEREPYLLDRNALESIAKGLTAKNSAVLTHTKPGDPLGVGVGVTIDGEPRGFYRTGFSADGVEFGEWPNYKQVLPDADASPTAVFGMSAKYLKELCAAVGPLSDKGFLEIVVRDDLGPVEFLARGGEENGSEIKAQGVIMPARLRTSYPERKELDIRKAFDALPLTEREAFVDWVKERWV